MREAGDHFDATTYRRWRAVVRFLFRAWFRVRVHHEERVPAEGALVMCPNHSSYLDPILIGAFSPRPVRFMMLRSYYDRFAIGALCRAWGSFPVDENRINKQTFRISETVLKRREVLGMFPEGGRSRTGLLRPGMHGAVILAMRMGAPVTPAGIRGAFEAYPSGARFPKPRRIDLNFGEPFTEHLAYGYPDGKDVVPALTERLMARIQAAIDEIPR